MMSKSNDTKLTDKLIVQGVNHFSSRREPSEPFFSILSKNFNTIGFTCELEDYKKINNNYEDARNKLLDKIKKTSIILPIYFWQNKLIQSEDSIHELRCFLDLLDSGILPLEGGRYGIFLLINKVKFDHEAIIDAIRCKDKDIWGISWKEGIVSSYLNFVNYLCEFSQGFFKQAIDPDRYIEKNKALSFDAFISLINLLSLRDRAIAKLLYFGCEVNQGEIFPLQIKQVDFAHSRIMFDSGTRFYPKHVIHDIRKLIGRRFEGLVFLSKQGKKLDPTVPYRAVKSAAIRRRLSHSFSLKNFTDPA